MSKIIITLWILINSFELQAKQPAPVNSAQIQHDIELVQFFQQQQKQAAGGVITVGGEPNGCDFNNIQDAIDSIPAAGNGEIHIATNQTYNENLVIDDISVSLIGGYEDCVAAGSTFFPPSDDQVLVNGGNAAPALTIKGSSQRHSITLENLRLFQGVGLAPNSDSTGGGLLAYQSNSQIMLDNVDVRGNEAEYGGGIAIINGNTDMILSNSRVIDNSASYGGGVYCSGLFSSVVMIEESGVKANVATGIPSSNKDPRGRAGGLYISGCQFSMYSGSVDNNSAGIVSNIAFGNGGGIYADASAGVLINGHRNCEGFSCIGDEVNPVNISSNIAGFTQPTGLGGGLYSEGSTTQVNIHAALIENNFATTGGGIYVDDSNLTVERLNRNCWDKVRCNFFDANSASEGGAIANEIGDVFIQHSYFENNIAVQGAAVSSFGMVGVRHEMRIENSVFNHNGDSSSASIFDVQQSGAFRLINSTVADNTLEGIGSGAGVIKFDGITSLTIGGGIIFNLGTKVLEHSNAVDPSAFLQCIIANELDSLNAIDNNNDFNHQLTADIPGFEDAANRDYHLAADSIAIDACVNFFTFSLNSRDIDFEPREYDDPNVISPPNDDLDIGADEYLISDFIFTDDFE